MMGNYFGNGYGFMGGFGFFFMIFFWGLVIWAIITLVQSVSRNNTQSVGGSQVDTALEMLRKRYAKGEITKAEFDQMKKDLAE
ncbi:MAG: SHOCT domain-containing protein [Minisyncoccota bacterium]